MAGFQGALARLAIEAGNASNRLVSRVGELSREDALAFVTDAFPELIDPFVSASGELTAQWYDENRPRALTGSSRETFMPEPARMPDRKQLASSARWALSSPKPSTALQGSSTRYVFDESRRTVRDNAEREGVRWTRHASADACGFCRMLATRVLTQSEPGAPGLYRSKATASRNAHTTDIRGHDHCKCIAVVARPRGA